jgi:cobaltochelatase CobN
MKVVFVFSHPMLFRAWERVCETLGRQGIEVRVASQTSLLDWETFIEGELLTADAVYINLSRYFPSFEPLVAAAKQVRIIVPDGVETRSALPGHDPMLRETVAEYLLSGTVADLMAAARYLLAAASSWFEKPSPPKKTVLCGVLDSNGHRLLEDVTFDAQDDRPIAALCFGRTLFLDSDMALPLASAGALESRGFCPLPIFCDWDLATRFGNDPGHPLHRILSSCGDRLACIWNGLFSHTGSDPQQGSPFAVFGVPVFQIIRHYGATADDWRAGSDGLSPMSICYSLTQPEMLGCIEPTLLACNRTTSLCFVAGTVNEADIVYDRIEHLADRAQRWQLLKEKPNADKKVAIMLHSSPCKSVEATLATAAGLDAAKSTVRLLRNLEKAGYRVLDIPENGAALIALLLDKKAIQEFRWTNINEIVNKGGVLSHVDESAYMADFSRLSPATQKEVNDAWGLFPGESMVHLQETKAPTLVVTGLCFGNVSVLIEPKRGCYGPKCDGEVCRILHEPDIPPTHHFLATYFFLQRTVDALVPMGAESPVEYLPGKRAGLSERCFPEIVLGDLPVIYPYIMTATGEGILAKRRGRAVIVDHLSPATARLKDLSGRFDDMEELYRQYRNAEAVRDSARKAEVAAALKSSMSAANLVQPNANHSAFDDALEMLPQKLAVLKERTQILAPHVLGETPSDEMQGHYISEAREGVGDGFDKMEFQKNISRTPNEIHALLSALNGRFVAPGPSGHLSRGKVETLPTGRNFFGLDLRCVPTKAAYAVGACMGEQLLRKYLNEENRFPKNIGIVLWSSDVFRSEGELVSQILWLLGCAPQWRAGGRVAGLEIVPAGELRMTVNDGASISRPRIDVTVQMSGVVRDTLPTFYEMIDDAVTRVAELDEPDTVNYVRAHVSARLDELMQAMSGEETASMRKLAAMRVFSSKPGSYGNGVNLAVDASAWQDDRDLAEAFVNWTGYGFGKGNPPPDAAFEEAALSQYATLLKSIDVSYQKACAAEYDALSISCYAGFQGGMAAAKQGLGGGETKLYWGDSVTSARPEIRDLKDEIDLGFSAQLLNPDWTAARKQEGYQGAGRIATMVNTAFAWSATARVVTKAQFDGITRVYIEDDENRAWLQKENPYALEEISRRLLEADARGLWQADDDELEAVKQTVLVIEGDLEDSMGTVQGEFQGGSVDIKTQDQVDAWQYRFQVKR